MQCLVYESLLADMNYLPSDAISDVAVGKFFDFSESLASVLWFKYLFCPFEILQRYLDAEIN
jgi:hypothetical protein